MGKKRKARRKLRAQEQSALRVARRQHRAGQGHRSERILQEALALSLDPEVELRQRYEDSGLAAAVLSRGGKLARGELRPVLDRLWRARESWIRAPEDWTPRGRSVDTQLRSLLAHLLCRYPVPRWLLAAFEENRRDLRRLCIGVGQGAGLHRRLQREDMAHLPRLTRKMCHVLMTRVTERAPLQAIRLAQVLGFGGRRTLADALCRTHLVGGQLGQDEGFVEEAVHWACRQANLGLAEAGPLFDYVGHRRVETPGWSMKGRTVASLRRGMEEWHEELRRDERLHGCRFPASGFASWHGERRTRGERQRIAVVEILRGRELGQEGARMRHCVASYALMIQRGRCSIWSLRVDGTARLTLEVDNAARSVAQIRGRRNRLPTGAELDLLQHWAAANELRLRRELFSGA